MASGSHKATGSSIPIVSLDDFEYKITNTYPVSDWYFRGEPREYDRPFLPSIWRSGHAYTDQTPIAPDTSFTHGELAALHQCQSDIVSGALADVVFTKYFEDLAAQIDLANVDIFNWLALAQHYNQDQRYPTRLVDITTDPFVGLYFAAMSGSDQPGFVFVFESNFNDLEVAGKISSQGHTFLDVLKIDGADGLPYHPQETTLNLLRPPFPNARLKAQSGSFIWNRGIANNYFTGGFPFEIPPDKKPAIVEALNQRGYDNQTLFPEE